MSIVYEFQQDWEIKLYVITQSQSKLKSGSEGTCYLGKDDKVYKIVEADNAHIFDVDSVITEDDLFLPSFAFPDELYAVDGKVMGYRTRRVKKDLFSEENLQSLDNIIDLDFEKLAKAYYEMLTDIELLSDEKILIYELAYNLMFDGEKFTAIDTCGYKRVDYDPLQKNIESLNYAIESIFMLWFSNHMDLNEKINGTNIEEYLHRVMMKLPAEIGLKKICTMIGQENHKK